MITSDTLSKASEAINNHLTLLRSSAVISGLNDDGLKCEGEPVMRCIRHMVHYVNTFQHLSEQWDIRGYIITNRIVRSLSEMKFLYILKKSGCS